MLQFGLCLLTGAYVIHQAESLPSVPWLLFLGVISIALCCVPPLRCLGAFLLGMLFTSVSATAFIDSRLEKSLEGHTAEFVATIADFPATAGDSLRFVVSPLNEDLPARIRLSWYDADQRPMPGQQWQFSARLRAPRGFANPHGFDYEGWLFRQRVGATGYVVSGQLHDEQTGLVTALRRHLQSRIETQFPDDAARAVLSAVTIGARQDISREQWDLYARTGTSHLMAISGLHVGLAATGLFFLARVLVAPMARGRTIRDLALVVAASGATAYATVSGLAVPAQRALLMVLFVATALLLRRQQDPLRVLSIVAIVVVVADPLASLAPGFQLSFLAVLLLLVAGQRTVRAVNGSLPVFLARGLSSASRLAILQCVLLLGLLPLTVLQFGRVAWLAPAVNLLVLPVFNLVTVPLALLGFLLDGPLQAVGNTLLWIAWHSVHLVLAIVTVAAEVPGAELNTLPLRGLSTFALWVTALWALLPPGFPGRAVAWIGALAVLLQKSGLPPERCVDLHVLDVGQGLSVVMQTRSRIAVFDTGPSFRSGSDTAALVVVPFLRALDVRRIDKLLISHADLDHAGGLGTLLAGFAVDELVVGELAAAESISTTSVASCRAGQRWSWDGVEFGILHPDTAPSRTGNNASCVLRVSAGAHSALLSGDIERPVELALVNRGILQPSQLVVVPHHGSRTSSTPAFVEALQAEFAVVSAGYGNRWGFPRPEVVHRWQQSGATVLTTADSGAISQRICHDEAPAFPREQRRSYRRYWHAPSPRGE